MRDLLLGVKPKDFDLVSDATPEEIEGIFPKTIPIGKQFGIMVVVTEQGPVEVARFRSDGAYTDMRHPDEVNFVTDPALDAARRDFTVNALFYDPQNHLVLDYVNGKEDLEARVIRCVGEPSKRFEEDGLRVLRAVRFLAQLSPFGFSLEENTSQALQKNAARIEKVSKERITQELRKILLSPSPLGALLLLDSASLWEKIFHSAFPGAELMDHFERSKNLCRDHTISLFFTLLPETAISSPKLLLSSTEKKAITGIMRARKNLLAVPNGSLAEKKIALADEFFDSAWALVAGEGKIPHWLQELPEEKKLLAAHGKLDPAPFLNGNDLQQLGIKPGPEMKRILSLVRIEQLEEKIQNKEEALEFVRKISISSNA